MEHDTLFGTVTIRETDDELLSDPTIEHSVRVSTSEVTYALPHDFDGASELALKLLCHTAADGVRRFTPMHGSRGLILTASAIGHLLLAKVRDFNGDTNYSYHSMRLLYQHSWRIRERFGRRFKSTSDLFISKSGIERDVLPDDLGLRIDEQGNRWGIRELLQHGQEAAAEVGIESPTQEDLIRLGIREAARLLPYDLSMLTADETASLVRIGLFDLGSESVADEEVAERVTERLLDAINKHLDQPTGDFCSWIFEKTDNITHQIAKRKKGGGPIDRDVVRQVLLETSFRSHRYVADCMDLAMQDFEKAIPRPLSGYELELFRSLYRNQTEFGNLPLMMVADHFEQLRECVLDVIQDPTDRRHLGVLLRAMQFFAEMTTKRRAADREYKKAGHHRNREGKRAVTTPLDDRQVEQHRLTDSQMEDVTGYLVRKHSLTCECDREGQWRTTVAEQSSDGSFEVLVECEECGVSSSITLDEADQQALRNP